VSEDERNLPLFPLNTVLFPGMVLPLHIFEERYRLMIRACLDTDRTFGVCLIRTGQEVGGPAEPFEIGTIARIAEAERLPDGRMNLLTVGITRFRLLRVVEQTPFLVGRVEPLPAVVEAVEGGLAASVADRFRAYVGELGGEGAGERLRLPDDPEALSFQVAATLGVAPRQRQRLLEARSTTERLRREEDILKLLATAPSGANAGQFSLN
jgi:uncharacterized protein